MTTFEHVLSGCAPVPLAGYLKALGVLRLIAEQADPDATGFWRDERFVLRTKLSGEELVRFFVEAYEPSPIISPWNGRAGFLEGDDGESSRQGAELIRRYEGAAERFSRLRKAVETYRSVSVLKELDIARAKAKALEAKKKTNRILQAEEEEHLKQLKAIIKRCKASAIATLRSEAPDGAVDWFDACQRIGPDSSPMPLLGSGGNDGSRDFGMNFGEALAALFDLATGRPNDGVPNLVRTSLYATPIPGLRAGNVGQYEPGAVGENTSSGFSGELPFNPFDLILLLEGAILFSGSTTRRLGTDAGSVSFPFTVRALTIGSGAAAASDDQGFWEFWSPIWTRASGLDELHALLTEGRVVVDGKTASDGLEFAVAVCRLGADRGILAFERYALLQREPRNPRKATPLGRVRVQENARASLVTELDSGAWLSRMRTAVRGKSASASLAALGRRLNEALFRLTGDRSPDAAQEVLIAVGELALEAGRRPQLREDLPPPPRLSARWMAAADDGSHEFALAAALASLDAATTESRSQLPFRCHLASLGWHEGRETWDDSTASRVLAVWTGRDLVRDMIAVLERRLIEAQRWVFLHDARPELPLRSRQTAPLAAVATFLAARTDDDHIASLAGGLAWVRCSSRVSSGADRENLVPFAFAALKPLFEPRGIGQGAEMHRPFDPLPLVRLLRTGRAEDAVSLAQRMTLGVGLPIPFARCGPARVVDAARLAASLLFPIAPMACGRLIERAYADLSGTEEEADAA